MAAIHHSPYVLPPLPHFPQSPPPISRSHSATISESSTRISDLSSMETRRPPLKSNLSYGPVDDRFASTAVELAPPVPLSDHLRYIPILPRTSLSAGLFTKQCETCHASHDGSFGAGRFCSSRCARTVGGLAHRKKRLLERGMKARNAAEKRVRAKKVQSVAQGMSDYWGLQERASFATSKPIMDTFPTESPRSVMEIGALLNPTD